MANTAKQITSKTSSKTSKQATAAPATATKRNEQLLYGHFRAGFAGTKMLKLLWDNAGKFIKLADLKKINPEIVLESRIAKFNRFGGDGTGPKKAKSPKPFHLVYNDGRDAVKLVWGRRPA